ncbi:MAG: AbrB/MazE/SpoVT family DNA-binding domain-containing protein [Bryobacteraceae bacterium]
MRSGNSQAIRIPREFHLDIGDVEILRRGDELVIRKPPRDLSGAFDLLASMPKDLFKGGRCQPKALQTPTTMRTCRE